MKYKILDSNNNIINTIVADEEFMLTNYPEGNYLVVNDQVESVQLNLPTVRHITRLAFLSRFTDAEAVAIDLASIGATVQAASLRRYLAKVNAASFIDLNRPDTRAGVQQLEALGTPPILAAGRALEILDAPIQPEERPIT